MQKMNSRPWLVIALVSCLAGTNAKAAERPAEAYVGNESCGGCHSKIFTTYAKTAMAHASGPSSENPIVGSFFHRQSGVAYRVSQNEGKLWLEFNRQEAPKLAGKRQLLYYIGSARLKGRTYLYEVDGFLFESPINWYAQQRLWDMTPNYQYVREAPLNLPAFPECLNCHASGMHPPESGTSNRYPQPPFAHGGVTCERCHGPAADHVASGKEMLKLERLPASRRDAICMQCHLEGDVTIERLHRLAYLFKPGDDLSDFVRYFVFANKQGTRAVSQFEALAKSGCKRASGDNMRCTTCHDPHSSPDEAKKLEYYRSKCIACHGPAFAQKHHPENPNCIECHMPALSAKDISHTQVTDHRILRRPSSSVSSGQTFSTSSLEPFPATAETKDDVRDLALAYEALVERGDSSAVPEAERLLQEATRQDSNDAPVLAALGYIAQHRGNVENATRYYEAALRNDPEADEAATNLGVLEAKAGHLRRAVSLWQSVFQRAPWRSSVGVDIALGYCSAGRFDKAAAYVNRVLEFNPDFGVGRSLLTQLQGNPPGCSLQH